MTRTGATLQVDNKEGSQKTQAATVAAAARATGPQLEVEKASQSPESTSTTTAEERVDILLDVLSVSVDRVSEASVCSNKESPLRDIGLHELSEQCLPEASHYGLGEYVPLWCKISRSSHGSFLEPTSMPAVSGAEQPQLSAEDEKNGVLGYMPLWCWKQLDRDGDYQVVICTDKEPLLEAQEPMSKAEEACAPPCPATGAYRPRWMYGPCYPFNVEPTTLHIENLPEDFTVEDVSLALDGLELSGLYDFIVVFEDGSAVVNFVRHRYALNCAASLQGKYKREETDEACVVTWDQNIQGLNELVAFYANHSCNSPDAAEDMRPQLFVKGWPKPVPQRK